MKNFTTITIVSIWFAVLCLVSVGVCYPEMFEASHHVMGYGEVSNLGAIILLALPFSLGGAVTLISFAWHKEQQSKEKKAIA